MRTNTSLLGLIVAIGFLASGGVNAQETAAPAAAPTTSPPVTPARGSTMDMVREKFGSPSQQVAAIGEPPISRWEYPGYIVFFENDRVLHTVILK